MGKKIIFILLVLFQFQFLHARNLPGHTGGGHLIDGQLLDFYFSEKTTKIVPEELPQYKDVEEKLWPLIKILPGYGFHLLGYFKDIDWYFTKENIKCADPDTNSMIYLDTQATAFACQNNVEVIINENLFYSLSPENQTYGFIHELLRAHQKNYRISMPDTSIFRLLKIIKDLNKNPNMYSYKDLVKRMYRLNAVNNSDLLGKKDNFTKILLDKLQLINATIDNLYPNGEAHPQVINHEEFYENVIKLYNTMDYYKRYPENTRLAVLDFSHYMIKKRDYFLIQEMTYLNIIMSFHSTNNLEVSFNKYKKFFDELTYDDLRHGKETIEDTLVRLL